MTSEVMRLHACSVSNNQAGWMTLSDQGDTRTNTPGAYRPRVIPRLPKEYVRPRVS